MSSIEAIVISYKHQIHLIFMNEPNKIEPLEGPKKIENMTRCTKHVLSKDVCYANQLLP